MKSTITWIVSRVLSDYIEAINPKEFELELMKLQVKLINLSVKKDILIKNNIPCKINKGIVGGIEIKLSSVTKIVPATFSLNDIFVLSTLKPQAALDFARNIKSTEFTEIDQFCIKENLSKKDLFEGTLGSILSGLTGKISNVHIRIEFKQDDIQMAAGVLIKSASLNDLKAETSDDTFVKALKIEGFSIYLDSRISKINTKGTIDEYKTEMRNAFNNHEYILKDFNFTGLLEHSKSTGFNKITVYTPGFDLAINSQQYKGFLMINKDRMKMNKLLYYSPCGRPDETEGQELEWFHYLHKAAYKKKFPLTVRFDDIKQFLDLRKNTKLISEVSKMLLIPEKKKREKIKQKILREVDGDMIVRLSSYCHMINLLETKRKIKDQKSETYDEITKTISQSIGSFNKQSISLDLKSDQIKATVYDGNPIGTFTICNIESNCNMRDRDIDFRASIGDIKLINLDTGKDVLKMERTTKCASVNFLIDQKNLKFTVRAGLVEPIIYADFNLFQRFGAFAKGSLDGFEGSVDFDKTTAKLGQKSQLYINHIIETKYKLDADLTFGAPSIILPTPEEIIVKIGMFKIRSIENANPNINNPLSLYDKYELTCNNFMILNGSENILEPISMKVNLQNLFVPIPNMLQMIVDMDLAKAQFKLKRSQYLNLLKISDIIPKSNDIVPDEPNTSEEKKIVINKKMVNRAVEMTQQTTSSFSIQLGFLFEKASILLLTEEGEIENQFQMNSMKTALEFFNGKLNAEFNIQKLLATQGTDNVFCKFGDDAVKAFDVLLSHSGNVTDVKVLSDSPTIKIDPQWIIELQHFFEVNKPHMEVKPKKQPEQNVNTIDLTRTQIYDVISEYQTKITVKAEIKTPELRVCFPVINSKESQVLSFGFDSLSANVIISDTRKNVDLNLEWMYFSLNSRHVLDPVSANISLDFTNELILNGGLPVIRIILDHSDLLLAQDMFHYVSVYVSNLLRKSASTEHLEIDSENTQEEKDTVKSSFPSISIYIEGMQLIIKEGGVSRFIASIFQMDISIGEEISVDIESAEIAEKITSEELTPFFKLDHKVTVKVGESINVDVGSIQNVKFSHNVAKWLIKMAINPAYVHIIDIPIDSRVVATKVIQKVETKKTKSSLVLINLSNFTGILEYEDKTFANFQLYDILFKMEDGISIIINFFDVQCPDLGCHSDMLSVNKFKFDIEGANLGVDIGKLYFGYHQDFFLEKILGFIMSLLPDTDGKPRPINLPLFNYTVRAGVANIGIIPRDLGNLTFVKAFKLQLDTSEDMKTLNCIIPCGVIYDASGIEIGKVNGIGAKIVFQTSPEIPIPEIPHFDTSHIETEGKNFLHKTDFIFNVDFAKFIFDNNSNRRLVNCLNALIPMPTPPKAFPFNLSVLVDISEYGVIIASQKPFDVLGSDLRFTYESTGMVVTMKKILCYNMHGDTPFLEMGTDEETGFVCNYSSDGINSSCSLTVERPCGLLDLPAIMFVIPYVMNSGFMEMGAPKQDNNKGKFNFSAKVNHMFLEALVSDAEILRLFVMGSIDFSKTSGIQFDVKDMKLGICDGKDYEHPICNDISFSYFSNSSFTDTSHTFYISKVNAIISTIDISALLILLTRITPYMNYMMDQMSSGSVEVDSDSAKKEKEVHVRQNIGASIGKIHVALAFAGKNMDGSYREAFIFNFDEFNLISSDNDYNAAAVIKNFQYFSPSTRQWDTVIEPVKLNLTFKDNLLDISGTSFNVNFSMNIINEVMRFLDEMKAIQEDSDHIELHIKGLPYFLVNNLGESIYLGKEEVKPNQEKELFGLSDGNTIAIKVHEKEFNISIGELFYPNFLFRNVVCFFKTREDRREVVISSAIVFSTKLVNLVLVTRNPDSRCNIEEHTKIPFDVTSNTEFHIERANIRPQFEPTRFKYNILRRGALSVSDGLPQSKFVLIPNYDVNSGVLKINVLTNSHIRNELPDSIMVRFSNSKNIHEIAPYDQHSINLPDNVRISVYIKKFGESSMGSFVFQTIKKKDKMGMKIYGRNIDFMIENIYDEESMQRTVRIYAQCIVFNCSPFAFKIANQHNKTFGDSTEDPMYIDASNYTNNQQLVVKPYVYTVPKNGVDIASISSFALPKYTVVSSAVLPLNGVVTSVSGAPSTSIVTFFAALHIDNHLNDSLLVSPYSRIDANTTEVPPGRILPLKNCDSLGGFYISLDSKVFVKLSIHPRNRESFELQQTNGSSVAVEINYERQPKGCNISLIITRCPIQGPVIITNETDISFGIKKQNFVANSSQTLHGQMPDSIPIAGASVKINDGNPTRTKSGDLYAYTTWLSSGSLQITVSRNPLIRLSRKITVKAFLSELSVSLIDAYCRETVLLSLYQVSLKTNPLSSFSKIDISIKTIKVDDMHNAAAFPAVAVITADNAGNPGVRVSFDVIYGRTSFDNANIRINTIYLYVDGKFVNDVYMMAKHSLMKSSENKVAIRPAESVPSYTIYDIQKLDISGIRFIATYRGQTRRPNEFPFKLEVLRKIPNLTGIDFRLNPVSIKNLSTDSDDLSNQIIAPYMRQLPIGQLIGGVIDSLTKQLNYNLTRERPPRCILGRQISVYNEELARYQAALCKGKRYKLDIVVDQNDLRYAFTPSRMFITQRSLILSELAYNTIKAVQLEEGNVLLRRQEGDIKIETGSYERARTVFLYIRSHFYSYAE